MNYKIEEMTLTELWIRKQLCKPCEISYETYQAKLRRAGFEVRQEKVGSVMIFHVTK